VLRHTSVHQQSKSAYVLCVLCICVFVSNARVCAQAHGHPAAEKVCVCVCVCVLCFYLCVVSGCVLRHMSVQLKK